jgi:hypothetical protein
MIDKLQSPPSLILAILPLFSAKAVESAFAIRDLQHYVTEAAEFNARLISTSCGPRTRNLRSDFLV